MDPFRAALEIAQRIPDTDEYRLEREFCRLTVGKAALALGDEAAFKSVLNRLPEGRTAAQLRLSALVRPGWAEEFLPDFLERLDYWQDLLWRGELADLAKHFVGHFSATALVAAISRLEDPFTRTAMLTEVADATRDPVMKRTLLLHARQEADAVFGDRDYALKHVASSYMQTGWFDEARECIQSMHDPAIRLDYLEYLGKALADSGDAAGAGAAAAERGRLEADHPDTRPQSEILAEAETLLAMDLDDDHPSNATLFKHLTELVDSGDLEGATERIKTTFPTRFCPVVFRLRPERLRDVLLFQLTAIQAYRLNDLKVEFLTELALEVHRESRQVPPDIERFVSTPEFLAIAPAALPSIRSVDPSQLDFETLVRVLFDRPVPATEEEKRIFERERDDDPEVEDPAALVRLAAELFTRFGQVAPQFTPEQVDQAMWVLLGFPYDLSGALQSRDVTEEAVVDCILRGFHVFADYVAREDLPEHATKFYMWWDEFWRFESQAPYAALIEVMGRVLELDDDHSRTAALHGLNHLIGRDSPVAGEATEMISSFLERQGNDLPADLREYAELCRQGKAQ